MNRMGYDACKMASYVVNESEKQSGKESIKKKPDNVRTSCIFHSKKIEVIY